MRRGLNFRATAVSIDNLTSQPVSIPGGGTCPAWTQGWVTLITPTTVAEAAFRAAEGMALPASISGTLARITWTDDPLQPSLGVSVNPLAQQQASIRPLVSPATIDLPPGTTGFTLIPGDLSTASITGAQSTVQYANVVGVITSYVNFQDRQLVVSWTGGSSASPRIVPFSVPVVVAAILQGTPNVNVSDNQIRAVGMTAEQTYSHQGTTITGAGVQASITIAGVVGAVATLRYYHFGLVQAGNPGAVGATTTATITGATSGVKHSRVVGVGVTNGLYYSVDVTRLAVWFGPTTNEAITISFTVGIANVTQSLAIGLDIK